MVRPASGVGVVQGQGQVVDAGPFGHEGEVGDKHQGLALEDDVVIPKVTVHQLPRQPGHQAGFAGLVASSASRSAWLAIRRSSGGGCQPRIRAVPARVPDSTAPGSMWLANSTLRPDFRTGEQGVDAAQQWQPAGQPRRGVHPPVVRDVPFHLDQPPG